MRVCVCALTGVYNMAVWLVFVRVSVQACLDSALHSWQ